MISRGVRVDQCARGTTALIEAVRADEVAVVQSLIRAGAHVNAIAGGTTALILATTAGRLKAVVGLVVQKGVYVWEQLFGKVPSRRDRQNREEIIKMLVDAGADANIFVGLKMEFEKILKSGNTSEIMGVVKTLRDMGFDSHGHADDNAEMRRLFRDCLSALPRPSRPQRP